MSNYTCYVGKQIRKYRKAGKMTLQDLADAIHKSRAMGLNLLLIIPGVLVANTPLWIVYPYCYSGYVVSNALHTVTATDTGSTLSLFPFIPCAVIISVFAICVSIKYFGRKEMS